MHKAGLSQRFPSGPLLRSVAELQEPTISSEQIVRVSSARVVLADYDLLQHDFADLRTENLLRHNQYLINLDLEAQNAAIRSIIDDWLVANSAFISVPQANQAVVNTPMETSQESVTGYRPPMYGRALITSLRNNQLVHSEEHPQWEVTCDGLLDIKGAGVQPGKIPSHGEHSDGLEYLARVFVDYVYKRAIDEIFRRAAPGMWTIPLYAIIDLGFDILDGWRGTSPAGLHVRRAHRRPLFGLELPAFGSADEAIRFEVEMLLRSYGLTSASTSGTIVIENCEECEQQVRVRYNGQPIEHLLSPREVEFFRALKDKEGRVSFDGVNIQLAREVSTMPASAQLTDLGHYNVRRRFDKPIVSLVYDRAFALGGIIWPDSPVFVQPDPALNLSPRRYYRAVLDDVCFGLAEKFRADEISRSALSLELDKPLEYLLDKWSLA